jgi:signal peptidase II
MEVVGLRLRYYLLALAVILLDQWSKWLVVTKMALREQIPVIDGFFYLTSHRNRGAAFGILQNQQWLFISITTIVILFIVIYLWKVRKQFWMSFSLSLVLGGAIGNLLDRIRNGEVVDFFHFQFGTYQFPIFNVADSMIVVGVFILAFLTVFSSAEEVDGEFTKAGSHDS